MRFTRMLIICMAISLVGAGLFGAASSHATTVESPVAHGDHALHNCADVCAVSNNTPTVLPSAILQHDEEQEEVEADPAKQPDPQFYANFTRHINPQKIIPPGLYDADTIKPPDIYKLDTSYLN